MGRGTNVGGGCSPPRASSIGLQSPSHASSLAWLLATCAPSLLYPPPCAAPRSCLGVDVDGTHILIEVQDVDDPTHVLGDLDVLLSQQATCWGSVQQRGACQWWWPTAKAAGCAAAARGGRARWTVQHQQPVNQAAGSAPLQTPAAGHALPIAARALPASQAPFVCHHSEQRARMGKGRCSSQACATHSGASLAMLPFWYEIAMYSLAFSVLRASPGPRDTRGFMSKVRPSILRNCAGQVGRGQAAGDCVCVCVCVCVMGGQGNAGWLGPLQAPAAPLIVSAYPEGHMSWLPHRPRAQHARTSVVAPL